MAGSDKEEFLKVFEELADGLVQDEVDDQQVTIAVEWIKRMIHYNVPHGKLNRGLAVVDGVRALKAAKNEEVTPDELKRAMVVGWCIEFLQAYFWSPTTSWMRASREEDNRAGTDNRTSK